MTSASPVVALSAGAMLPTPEGTDQFDEDHAVVDHPTPEETFQFYADHPEGSVLTDLYSNDEQTRRTAARAALSIPAVQAMLTLEALELAQRLVND